MATHNGVTLRQTVVSVPAGASTALLPNNPQRTYLGIQTSDTITLGFDAPATTAGWAVSSSNVFGAGYNSVPMNGINAYSVAGATVVVTEGI